MRYLVFGDVHGNLLALDAVLKAGRDRGAETYLFVGDVVGYGPNPVECIERLLPLQECGSLAWVAGNHELAFRGDVEMEGYSAEAVQTLMWGRKLVEDKPWAKDFIDSAYLTTCANDLIWLTHDSLANPEQRWLPSLAATCQERTGLPAVQQRAGLFLRAYPHDAGGTEQGGSAGAARADGATCGRRNRSAANCLETGRSRLDRHGLCWFPDEPEASARIPDSRHGGRKSVAG